jgi:hypothetical protein
MIIYFKILNLPTFILDFDYSLAHMKAHCTQIMKFLPSDKRGAFFGQLKSRISNSNLKNLPPRLDQRALGMLNS